jgi:GT2 family glycosyltransferase
VAFIDDDDEWLPLKLERQLQALVSNAAAVACTCSYRVEAASGAAKVTAPRAATVAELLTYNSLGGASMCLCSAESLRDIGGFDASLRAGQDLDLWVRLRQKGEVAVCSETLVVHRAHAGPRITTNAHSQYLGVRHFYFKHRRLMDRTTRRHRVAYCCYVMSMQDTRRPSRRLRFLVIAVRHALPQYSPGFVRQSVSLLLKQAFSRGRAAVTPTYAARK